MDKAVFEKILAAQEELHNSPEHKSLMEEYERLNNRFLQQVQTMTPEQQTAVWDYCGMLIEMHLRTLKIVAS